jgi:hypothetical protein
MMIKKMILAFVASVFLMLSVGVSAETVTIVWTCELNDGKTREDALAVNAKWLKWAHGIAGTDAITSNFVTTAIGEFGGFLWVDSYPDLATWAKVAAADLEDESETSAAFDELETCSGNTMHRSKMTVPAK